MFLKTMKKPIIKREDFEKVQEIIKNTPSYLENYGPFIINKINNGNPTNATWARNIKNGHYDHIHISIPK